MIQLSTSILTGLSVGLMISTNLSAQAIVDYTFASDLSATTADANLTASALGNGSGFTVSRSVTSGGNAYVRTSGTGLNDLADAITAGEYISFTVTPQAGAELNLSSLTLKAGYSNSGSYTNKILTQSVLSSVDGFTASNLLGAVSTADTSSDTGAIVYRDLAIDLSRAGWEFTYPHRRDAVARKLTYRVVGTTDLATPDWSTDGITETGTSVIDDAFEQVIKTVPTDNSSGFFRVEIERTE